MRAALANLVWKGYLKREPRACANRTRGWHGAVKRPRVRLLHYGFSFSTPAHRMSRGQLLFSVGRQKQDQGNDEHQGENDFPHGSALLFRMRRADALARG